MPLANLICGMMPFVLLMMLSIVLLCVCPGVAVLERNHGDVARLDGSFRVM
jgi:hypothetical protein